MTMNTCAWLNIDAASGKLKPCGRRCSWHCVTDADTGLKVRRYDAFCDLHQPVHDAQQQNAFKGLCVRVLSEDLRERPLRLCGKPVSEERLDQGEECCAECAAERR